jgi:hypothetical protein
VRLFDQIIGAAAAAAPKENSRHNPRPAGVPLPECASACVMEFLRSVTGLRSHAQITVGVNRARADREQRAFSGNAISCALVYLRRLGRVDAVGDPTRNARYLRYRAKREEAQESVVTHSELEVCDGRR